MYELKKKLEKKVNLLGPDPRLTKKGIYRAAVSQTLRNAGLRYPGPFYPRHKYSGTWLRRHGRDRMICVFINACRSKRGIWKK